MKAVWGLGKRGTAGGEGSEVTSNLRARLFGWLGDNGYQLGISVIGTTNFPNRLDPAAIDRFSIVPVLQPSAAELVQPVRLLFRRARRKVSIRLRPMEVPRVGSGPFMQSHQLTSTEQPGPRRRWQLLKWPNRSSGWR